MRYFGTNQPTGKNVYVCACKLLQNTLKKNSSSGLSLGPSQRILVFFFFMKVRYEGASTFSLSSKT